MTAGVKDQQNGLSLLVAALDAASTSSSPASEAQHDGDRIAQPEDEKSTAKRVRRKQSTTNEPSRSRSSSADDTNVEKDEAYWERRRRNNEAAKRSREKRRLNDMVMESRLLELSRENSLLKNELEIVKHNKVETPPAILAPQSFNLPTLLNQLNSPPAPIACSPGGAGPSERKRIKKAASTANIPAEVENSPNLEALLRSPATLPQAPPNIGFGGGAFSLVAPSSGPQPPSSSSGLLAVHPTGFLPSYLNMPNSQPPQSINPFAAVAAALSAYNGVSAAPFAGGALQQAGGRQQNANAALQALIAAAAVNQRIQQQIQPSAFNGAELLQSGRIKQESPDTTTGESENDQGGCAANKQYLRHKLLERQQSRSGVPAAPTKAIAMPTPVVPAPMQMNLPSFASTFPASLAPFFLQNGAANMPAASGASMAAGISPPVRTEADSSLHHADLCRQSDGAAALKTFNIATNAQQSAALIYRLLNGDGAKQQTPPSASPPSNGQLLGDDSASGGSPHSHTSSSAGSGAGGEALLAGAAENQAGGAIEGRDTKYVERRRRNNEAAKRCRANRRALFEFRFQRSQDLEDENVHLREEMTKLTEELALLKELVAKKCKTEQPAEEVKAADVGQIVQKVLKNDAAMGGADEKPVSSESSPLDGASIENSGSQSSLSGSDEDAVATEDDC